MSDFWLVATNGTRARVFAGATPDASLEEIECLVNPTGGRKEFDLVSDRPGRNADPSGAARSAVGETHHREESMDEFARQIAAYLNEHCALGAFDRVSIVASPAMLGRLRQNVSKAVHTATLEEVAKDVTTEDVSEIQSRLTRLNL